MSNNKKKRAFRKLKSCAVTLSLITMVSTGTSWAFTTYGEYQDVPPLKVKNVALEPRLQYKPSSTVTDSCLPLLKSIQKTSSQSVTDRNQRSAGKAAALGLIFGVRYALAPVSAQKVDSSESSQGDFDVWHDDGSSVVDDSNAVYAVKAYRSCQKKQALNATKKDIRW